MSFYEVLTVPCDGCGRKVNLPAGPHMQAAREGKQKPVFCTRQCNKLFVARTGLKQQQEQFARLFPCP